MLKPKYRFPEFQEDWLQTSLGKVVEENLEPIPMPKNGYTRVGIYCHAKGTFQEYVPEGKGLDVDTMYVVHKDNLIVNITFAWEHAIAITKKEDEGKIVSHRFPTYKFKEGQIPAFYKYLILDKRMEYNLMVASPGGAGRNRVLNKEQFLQIPIKHPSTTEQQKISDFLTKIDNKIKNQEQIVKDYEDMKKGLIQKLFSQQIRFKKQDGSNYHDWGNDYLGNLFTFKNGFNPERDAFSDKGIKCISVADVCKCNPILANEIKTNVIIDETKKLEFIVNYGDVLFQRSSETINDIGHASVYIDHEEAIFNGFVIRAQKKKDFYIPEFLHYLFQTDNVRKQTIRLGAGAQHYNIGQESLSQINIIYPCLEEQQKIADFLYTYDLKISKEQQILEDYKTLKKALLQQMFP